MAYGGGSPHSDYDYSTGSVDYWKSRGLPAANANRDCVTVSGTVTQLWDCNGSGAQKWQAASDGTPRNPASGRCLDATGPSSADGTRRQPWDCFAGSNQVWQLPA